MATAITTIPGLGVVGVGTAHAQWCDPIEVAKLFADDGASSDRFGNSVSVDGDMAVIGAFSDQDNGIFSGSAYVFMRVGGVWTQQTKLLPTDGAAGDYFGWSVSISGDTVVIGAYKNSDNGDDSGSAYVFTRSGNEWTQQVKLLPSDGVTDDYFGWSVSLHNETAVIGAPWDDDSGSNSGSAYVFERVGDAWTQQAKLLVADGTEGDEFGVSVSISGDTVVIGAAWDDNDNGSQAGSAYVFTRSGGVWAEQAKLLPPNGALRDWFGQSVSLSGDTVIIGSYLDDDNGTNSGSAYVFTRTDDAWMEQTKLLPTDGMSLDWFGWSVSISGETVVIGAYGNDDNGSKSGSAYIFTRNNGVWTQQAKLLPDDTAESDQFGWSVAVNGDTALIGTIRDNDNGTDSGSTYVYDLRCTDCPTDFDGDGIVDTRDFIAFLGAWSVGDSLADWDENGLIDTRDFIAYLGDWAAGCP